MLRFLLRLLFSLLLFAIGNLLTGGRGRRGGGRGPGRGEGPGGSGGSGRGAGAGGASRPPLDRSDVVDVPFTEVPPAGEGAPGSAGEPGRSG